MKLLIPFALLLATALALPATEFNTTTTLLPRDTLAGQDSGLTVDLYSQPNCQGTAAIRRNIKYHKNHPFEVLQSYYLSRDLKSEEQLDFSVHNPHKPLTPVNRLCSLYRKSAPNGEKKGCHSFDQKVSCFSLWHY